MQTRLKLDLWAFPAVYEVLRNLSLSLILFFSLVHFQKVRLVRTGRNNALILDAFLPHKYTKPDHFHTEYEAQCIIFAYVSFVSHLPFGGHIYVEI